MTLGAFRAKRRRNAPLDETISYMEQTVRELPYPDAVSNVIIARWHGPTATFLWTACGRGVPFLIGADCTVSPLGGATYPSLGRGKPAKEGEVKANSHQLAANESIVIVSDGVIERRHRDGGELGRQVIADAVRDVDVLTAPALVRALERRIVAASDDPLEDDATVVVFWPTAST